MWRNLYGAGMRLEVDVEATRAYYDSHPGALDYLHLRWVPELYAGSQNAAAGRTGLF